jgi:3-methyladenine DNA glycosylase AlkC
MKLAALIHSMRSASTATLVFLRCINCTCGSMDKPLSKDHCTKPCTVLVCKHDVELYMAKDTIKKLTADKEAAQADAKKYCEETLTLQKKLDDCTAVKKRVERHLVNQHLAHLSANKIIKEAFEDSVNLRALARVRAWAEAALSEGGIDVSKYDALEHP